MVVDSCPGSLYARPMSDFDNEIVMMVPVLDLITALDDSVDMSFGEWMGLFDRKMNDCSERFIESILNDGVQAPICVMVENGRWIQGNGNHRLTVMFRHDPFGEVPVVFSETRDYMMCDVTEGGYHLPDCW